MSKKFNGSEFKDGDTVKVINPLNNSFGRVGRVEKTSFVLGDHSYSSRTPYPKLYRATVKFDGDETPKVISFSSLKKVSKDGTAEVSDKPDDKNLYSVIRTEASLEGLSSPNMLDCVNNSCTTYEEACKIAEEQAVRDHQDGVPGKFVYYIFRAINMFGPVELSVPKKKL